MRVPDARPAMVVCLHVTAFDLELFSQLLDLVLLAGCNQKRVAHGDLAANVKPASVPWKAGT